MSTAYETLPESTVRLGTDTFAQDVLEGLSQRPKSIPAMYFYDDRGSQLFGQITETPEYYLTRCELEILPACARHLATLLDGQAFRLIELGAGEGQKVETLLAHFLPRRLDFTYVPIDICQRAVARHTRALRYKLPTLSGRIQGIVAEHSTALSLLRQQREQRNVVLFLGSSIGNFDPPATRKLLGDLQGSLGAGDYVLIGFDLKKDLSILTPAYDDRQGVTREFNLNLLDRVNRELEGDFDRRRFGHYACYNAEQGCMESWLVSHADQEVRIGALQRRFAFQAWEGLRVERSYKYHVEEAAALATAAGFTVQQNFFDRRHYFLDSLWQVGG